MPGFLQAVAKARPKLWSATGADVARWWRDREAVQMTTRAEAAGMRVQLRSARDGIENVRLILIPPASGKEPKLEAPGLEARLKRLDAQRWALVVPRLKAGTAELRIRF
jgi:hypothetical protein